MNTPIERIEELQEKWSFAPYTKEEINLSIEEARFIGGFRACEKEYQSLWQEYIDSLPDNEIYKDALITKDVLNDFQKWLEAKHNGK